MSGSRKLALRVTAALALLTVPTATAGVADRLARPQRLAIEVFNEPGTPTLELEHIVDGLRHGLFTYCLLEGLKGKAGGKQTPGFWGDVREPPVLWRRK